MAKKNTAQLTLFPETVYEYHVLLSPGDAVIADVDAMKQQLHEMIGLEEFNRNSIAHITLLKMEGPESLNLAGHIRGAITGLRKFTVRMAGHDIFEHGNTKTLYLKLANPEPVAELAQLANPKSRRAAKPITRQTNIIDQAKRPKKLHMIPHITIARTIAEADFERIEDFSPFDYIGEWVCDRILIRRRVAGSNRIFSAWKEVKLG
jgi:hypothetical protein